MLTLPMPPSVNKCWRNVPGKGRVKTKVYKEWRLGARWAIWNQRYPPLEKGTVHLNITVEEPALKRSRDIDNLIKPILDALVEARVLEDDKSKIVRGLTIRWDGEPAEQTLEIRVS